MSAVAATSTVPVALPSKEATIDELAAFYAQNVVWLRAVDSWLYSVKRRLGEAVRDQGPLVTPHGKVTLEGTGFEYPDEIATEFPGLGSHVITATLATLAQAEQALDILTEQFPKAEVAHTIKVDGRAAASLISKGGPAAHRLLDLRKSKGSLAVKP